MDEIELVADTDIKKVLDGLATNPETQHDVDVAEARKVMRATKSAPPYDAAAVTAFDAEEITAAPVEENASRIVPSATLAAVIAPEPAPSRVPVAAAVPSLLPLEVLTESDHLAPYTEYKPSTVVVNAAEYDVHVKEHTDARGRHFYEFDDGRSKPLLACIFETTAGHLIALNGIVMPLSAFQQIVYVRTAPSKLAKLAKANTSRATGDIRSPVPVSAEKVLCTMADGTVTTLVNTTVQHVMMALQHLAPPANRIETEQESAGEVEEHVGPLRRLWRWLY